MASLDALEKLLRVLTVERLEGFVAYYTIGGYAQHCLYECNAWGSAAPYPIYQDVGDTLVFDAIGFPAVPITAAKDGDGIGFGDNLLPLVRNFHIFCLVLSLVCKLSCGNIIHFV